MKEKKFTPGPWQFKATATRRYINGRPDDGSAEVCEVNETWVPNEASAANAHLISAAPELIDACEFFCKKCRAEAALFSAMNDSKIELPCNECPAFPALAKAYGES